jgi:hypothetical protein
MRWFGLIECAVIGALVMYGGDAIAADRAPGARWVIDVSGQRDAGCTSTNELTSFEHEVALACAAMGTCQVVDDARNAELRATLICSSREEPWRLELRTVEGTLVSSTELEGAREDRLREAAMEIARDQAPERTLAAASLRNTLGEGDKVKKPWKPPSMSLAFGAAGAVGGIERTSGGARALLGVEAAHNAHFTLGMTALLGGSGTEAARHLRTGLGVAFGAPFSTSLIGVVFEGGIALMQSYQTETGVRSGKAETLGGAYGQGGVVFALPLREIRPYVAFIGGVYAEPRATPYASADAGLAFPLF